MRLAMMNGNLMRAAALLACGLVCGAGPEGDPAQGAKLFLLCRACHAVAPGAPQGTGPDLRGVVGAKAGSADGFAYSPALAASGIVWTPAALDAWLTRPTEVVPGTTMAFAGLADPRKRADVIAYLATLGPR